MKYYAVSESRYGSHVKELELRETAKFLIDDKDRVKFRKVENEKYIATNSKLSDWTTTGYDIYPLDHSKPKEIIERNRMNLVVFTIKQEVEKKINKLSYDQYIELAKLLNIEIN